MITHGTRPSPSVTWTSILSFSCALPEKSGEGAKLPPLHPSLFISSSESDRTVGELRSPTLPSFLSACPVSLSHSIFYRLNCPTIGVHLKPDAEPATRTRRTGRP